MKSVDVILLAGGKGTRMRSEIPKVLVEVEGRVLIDFVVNEVKNLDLDKPPVVVVGYEAEQVKVHLGGEYRYVLQREQRGTGDAVASCRELLGGSRGQVMVFYGDMPLVSSEVMKTLAEKHIATGATMTLGTICVEDFEDWRSCYYQYGRILRGIGGELAAIVELKNASEEEKLIGEVNPGFYCFKSGWLWDNIGNLSDGNAQGEFLLTDLLAMAVSEGEKIETVVVDEISGLGVNTPEQLEVVRRVLRGT